MSRSFHKERSKKTGAGGSTVAALASLTSPAFSIDTQKARNTIRKLENAININEYARTAYSMKSRASDIVSERRVMRDRRKKGSS